jgi:NAD(P)H-hydrate repair Nnr-like enzyme with NAD(P)H-hydrate dehydratase domain
LLFCSTSILALLFDPAKCDRLKGRRTDVRQTAKRRVLTPNPGEVDMAKGQQRSNREAKKPKKEKIKVIAAAPSQKAGGWQPNLGPDKKK